MPRQKRQSCVIGVRLGQRLKELLDQATEDLEMSASEYGRVAIREKLYRELGGRQNQPQEQVQ